MSNYKGILTNKGKELLATATMGNRVNFSHLALGDGDGSTPTLNETRTTLVKECHRLTLNSVDINPSNRNQIICEAIIPTNIGGFTVRELGLFVGNFLVMHSTYPPTYKPRQDEGGAREMVIRVVINVQNADVIALYLDTSLVYATREWVETNFINHNEVIDNLVSNSTNKPLSANMGKKLNDEKVSLGTTQTITGAKTFSLAASFENGLKISTINKNTWATFGMGTSDVFLHNATSNKFLQLKDDGMLSYSDDKVLLFSDRSDAVNLDNTDKIATSKAVKIAYDKGVSAENLANTKANKTTQLTAGNGLTGGGDLSASRTLALGTPSKITATSTNVAVSNTHSHEIDKASVSVAGIVQLNDSLISTATNQAMTANMGKVLNESKLGNNGNQTLNNGFLTINNTAWAKLNFPLSDGSQWYIEASPSYKANQAGGLGIRFMNDDNNGTKRFYDLNKSDKNEIIAYQSWVNQQTAQISQKMVAKETGVNLDTKTTPCFFTHQGLTAKRLPINQGNDNDFAGFVIGHDADCTQIIAESGNLFVRGSDANPITQETDWTDWREILRNDTGVTLSDNQTIAGVKTFAANITVRGTGASNLTLGSGPDDVFIQNTRANKFLQLKDNGVLSYSEQKIYHEGNKPKWLEIEQTPNLITNPMQITSGDLNTYTAEGFYFCNANVHAAVITNTPINRAFSLQVLKTAGVVQILHEYQSSNVYMRALYDGNWTAWTRLATVNEVNSKLDKSGGVLAGHLQLNYQNEWVGYSANNPTEGKNGYYDVAVGGIARGGMQVIGRGGGRYDTIIGITPTGATTSDRRVGGLTVSQDGLHSSVYGFLHEYFVKTRDNQTIDGVKTFNKEIVVGSSNGWGRMTMPLTDGTNWVLETNPQYKSNPIGHPALRFNHNDGGTRRFYDLVKSDKNETIAYQSWVTSATVAKANHLTTARNITLTGAVTGNVNFDGSRNVSVDTVLNLAEFTNLKAENGYQRLPNGLILQWGKLTSDRYLGESTQSITFPIAFPTACLNVQANMYMAKHSPLGDGGIFVIDFNRNTAKFSLQNIGTNSVGDLRGFYWFSIGY